MDLQIELQFCTTLSWQESQSATLESSCWEACGLRRKSQLRGRGSKAQTVSVSTLRGPELNLGWLGGFGSVGSVRLAMFLVGGRGSRVRFGSPSFWINRVRPLSGSCGSELSLG